MDTRVKYLGLELKNPIVVGSCGLTSTIESLVQLEKAGAGAVVLKSLFEEQIIYDIKRNTHIHAPVNNYGDSYEYVAQHVADDMVSKHFALIKEAKQQLSIPIIGSINCYSYENWITYAKQFEEAGCDALELNVAILPMETSLSCDDVERTFSNIIQTLKKITSLPISLKVGFYFTDLAKSMQQLSWTGIQGITIFNKSLMFDIDVENEQLSNADSLTHPSELFNTIRWTAVLSKKLRCNLAATTGVETPEDVVKLILAGATVVQLASCLYRHGPEYISEITKGLESWMTRKGYDSVEQFRGKLAIGTNEKASMLLRTQFMRYFADIK